MLEQTLRKLVSFQTLSLNHNENQAALAWIRKELSGLPLRFEELTINGFPCLIAATKDLKKPKILLQGHIDVVDGQKKLFKLRRDKGKLIGRGIFDMKYAIAVYIELFQSFGSELKNLDLGMMITTDEELGGKNGVGALVKRGYRPQVCILPDNGADWNFLAGSKGLLQLRLKSYGQSGHGSKPWAGINAVEQLMDFLTTLRKEFIQEPCRSKQHDHATFNVGRVSGGAEINKIPDYAEADVDIRIARAEEETSIRKTLRLLQKKSRGIQIMNHDSKPYRINQHNAHVRMFVRICERELGRRVNFVVSSGSSDARYFALAKIPVIALRPSGGGHHSDHEWISRTDLYKFYVILKQFVEKISRIGPLDLT